ncbi:MAG: phosphate acyltransferase PlsX [Betaproteobacteria bacterium]|nr:phosphate acyltransferase PlsX [Betaproteobacteria bacterium]
MSVCVAVDCMGGDHGLSVTLPASADFLNRHPQARLILVGQQQAVLAEVARLVGRSGRQFSVLQDSARVTIVHAEQVVGMDDPPAVALKSKRQSSMRHAFQAVADGKADAAVSAGNTGALMAISRYVLKTLEGIDRPAIATAIPNRQGGSTLMLDLGANVDCGPEHLFQFAVMGAALVSVMQDKPTPTVALLNVGEEAIKGNEVVKQAADLLRASGLRFIGNVEGNDVYKGGTDVVVCDGFVGNVALKSSEGVAQMLGAFLREEFKRNWATKFAAVVASPVLRAFAARVDPRRYNGAVLLGLRGVVVKSHGSADAYAFRHALERAADAAEHGLIARISGALQAG